MKRLMIFIILMCLFLISTKIYGQPAGSKGVSGIRGSLYIATARAGTLFVDFIAPNDSVGVIITAAGADTALLKISQLQVNDTLFIGIGRGDTNLAKFYRPTRTRLAWQVNNNSGGDTTSVISTDKFVADELAINDTIFLDTPGFDYSLGTLVRTTHGGLRWQVKNNSGGDSAASFQVDLVTADDIHVSDTVRTDFVKGTGTASMGRQLSLEADGVYIGVEANSDSDRIYVKVGNGTANPTSAIFEIDNNAGYNLVNEMRALDVNITLSSALDSIRQDLYGVYSVAGAGGAGGHALRTTAGRFEAAYNTGGRDKNVGVEAYAHSSPDTNIGLHAHAKGYAAYFGDTETTEDGNIFVEDTIFADIIDDGVQVDTVFMENRNQIVSVNSDSELIFTHGTTEYNLLDPSADEFSQDSLQLYFPFDGNAYDYASYRGYNNGTLVTQITDITFHSQPDSFKHGSGAVGIFETGQYIGLSAMTPCTTYSMSVWVNRHITATTASHILTSDVDNVAALRLHVDYGQLQVGHNSTIYGGGATDTIPNNEWTHIGVTFSYTAGSDSTLTMYINGKPTKFQQAKTPNQTAAQWAVPLLGARKVTTEIWHGQLDEFKFYSGRVLTPAEMRNDYLHSDIANLLLSKPPTDTTSSIVEVSYLPKMPNTIFYVDSMNTPISDDSLISVSTVVDSATQAASSYFVPVYKFQSLETTSQRVSMLVSFPIPNDFSSWESVHISGNAVQTIASANCSMTVDLGKNFTGYEGEKIGYTSAVATPPITRATVTNLTDGFIYSAGDLDNQTWTHGDIFNLRFTSASKNGFYTNIHRIWFRYYKKPGM